MALYLVKHSRPDLANATRELSKQMIKADVGHLKHLYRLLKFIVDTKGAKLKLKPMKGNHWVMRGMCDASFASDLNNRRSVTGYMIFFLRSTGYVEEQATKGSD